MEENVAYDGAIIYSPPAVIPVSQIFPPARITLFLFAPYCKFSMLVHSLTLYGLTTSFATVSTSTFPDSAFATVAAETIGSVVYGLTLPHVPSFPFHHLAQQFAMALPVFGNY